MTIKEITLRVIDALNAANISHAMVGSFSSNYYGIPRSTEDVDFVLQLEGTSMDALLEKLGSDFAAVAQMTFETNTGTLKQELRFKDTEFKVELFRLSLGIAFQRALTQMQRKKGSGGTLPSQIGFQMRLLLFVRLGAFLAFDAYEFDLEDQN